MEFNPIIEFNPVEPIEYWQMDMIEGLIKTSSICMERQEIILSQFREYTKQEAEEIILTLQLNQTDPISSGRNYNQGDIIKHLRKL